MTPIRVEGGNVVAFVGQPNSVLAVVVTDEGRVMSTALSNLKVVQDDARYADTLAKVTRKRGASAG